MSRRIVSDGVMLEDFAFDIAHEECQPFFKPPAPANAKTP